MEKEGNYGETVESRLEQEFGPQILAAVKEAGRDSESETFEACMRKLESLLVESGVELTQTQRDALHQFLLQNGRDIGWPSKRAE